MIEQLIQQLIEALNANTAAQTGNSAVANTSATTPTATTAGAKPTKTAKPAKAEAEAKPEHSQEEVTAALIKIKDDFGIDAARAILKKYKYDKMGDIKPEHFDVVFAEAETAHATLTAEADGANDDDSGL